MHMHMQMDMDSPLAPVGVCVSHGLDQALSDRRTEPRVAQADDIRHSGAAIAAARFLPVRLRQLLGGRVERSCERAGIGSPQGCVKGVA